MTRLVDYIARLGGVNLDIITNQRLGVLQYQNYDVSGEAHLVRRILPVLLSDKPEPKIFDIGLNQGDYCRNLLSQFPHASVYGFEPNPETFQRALHRLSDALQVKQFQIGMSDAVGTLELYDYGDKSGTGHASLYSEVLTDQHKAANIKSHEVRVSTVDLFAAEHNVEHIHFMKIDTEGHELAVLRGAYDLLARKAIDAIQFEFNEMNVISRCFLRDFYEILTDFHFYRLRQDGLVHLGAYDSRNEIFKFQNILAVREGLNDRIEPFVLQTLWQ